MTASVNVGDLIDAKYRILRVLGEGGWGIVFEGENTRTLKHVAIKVLRPQSSLTADIIARFEREAQAAGRIGSDHIVEVFDLGSLDAGTHYMVMELLAGEDLATRLKTLGRLDPIDTVKIVVQLLEGLGAAHAAGILHRDLKPENLFLVPTRSGEDFVKILDFGISKFSNGPAASATMTGAVMGSPCYMAPEQARGLKQVDWRTDLYSVGTVLFECVTGRVPFTGDNFNDLMFKIVLAPRPSPLEFCPDLEPTLAAIISKAIAADPEQRFASAEDFRARLVEWLEAQGVSSVRAPDPHRSLKKTPSGQESRAAPPAPLAAEPQPGLPGGHPQAPAATTPLSSPGPLWSEATLPVDAIAPKTTSVPKDTPSAKETPIASTRTVRGSPRSQGKQVALVVVATAAVLATGGLMFSRLTAAGAPGESASPGLVAPPSPEPTVPGLRTGPAATGATVTVTVAPSAAPIVAAAQAAAVTDASTGPGPSATPVTAASTAAPAPPRSHSNRTSPPAIAEGPRTSSSPAATATATPAASGRPPVDKVEGRDIRGNL